VKILIVHQHFNTPEKGGALRSYFLASALVEHGHDVLVITGHNQSKASTAFHNGILVHYLPVPYDNAFGFYKRIRSFLKFIVLACKTAVAQQDVERCYAMSTPLTVGLVGIWLKWRRKVPFIFEVGDLWPEAPIQLGFIKNPILKFLLRRLEHFIYWQSSGVVALSVPMKKIIQQQMPGKKVYLLPNMADHDFFKPENKNEDLEQKFGVQDRFVMSYIGSIGFANGLEFMLDCARITDRANLPVTFLFCGEGAVLDSLKETTKKLAIHNVVFVPFSNREGVREVMNVTDAVFISYRNKPVLETGSPNKYFDGLAAGKLIITNFNGWIKEDIENYQCGFVVDYHKPEHLAKQLQPYLEDKNVLLKAQENAFVLSKKYSRTKLGEEYVKMMVE
jgi:glycosyltransferase involved in cell wall biosynthesis